MTASGKFISGALCALLIAGMATYALVVLDTGDRAFYASMGVVWFTRYFLLSAAMLGMYFSCRLVWLRVLQNLSKGKTWLRLTLISIPLLLISALLLYASLVFLCMV